MSVRFALLAVLVALGGAGCKKKIGDPCRRSTDCSLRGDRVCDLSHRIDDAGIETPSGRGECTIEGCGRSTCPKEGACVKAYAVDFLTIACDPLREDIASAQDGTLDDLEERCRVEDPPEDCCVEVDGELVCPPLDLCGANEVCLPEGLCADEITARTSCRRKCGDDEDCRNGYQCVRTGARGVYRAPDLDNPGQGKEVEVCVPEA